MRTAETLVRHGCSNQSEIRGFIMATIESIADCPSLPEVKGVEFRHCANFSGYAVGSNGTLWSCRGLRCTSAWTMRKLHPNHDGYLYTDIRNNGKRVTVKIAILVAEAFVGPKLHGTELCHNDGSRDNNVPGNLRWDTHTENMRDAAKMNRCGKHAVRGEVHGRSRLTTKDIEFIRLLAAYCSESETALMYGVNKATVGKIRRRERWIHVT